ncbi:hypothetical protein VFPFJ_09129 [Purpureocillium lilacinum]|uniref:Uncharacterized protein n=2 Tax=Purpureocillium lilacinum TaxID=33203 RepID=A0A179GFM3_PURLI|nr:hypothetical protein VFPFJ_09129 [Purpureocillium lilacinum]KAK4091881.1 hypothetical protein Purlil1_3720 [Purpureocillium lilacinum]OAQ76173.1 hypothetical protein VFPBJ_08533 [Purpureocillium lilacinum]OAQ83326.1 hypothetical protein VFPFJ_09129 [Purpureocillium lilacinum]PWI73377.1 hypothetical protein PCL_10392 [Purpureocillium lilacinum]GJN70396.1 hypothetical protein PLICBS_004452 [Purpureocillium lilacinum]
MKVLLGKNKTYRLIPRDWPPVHKRFVAWAMAPELAVLIALLVIFGISQPDMYRTDMWQIGFDNKLNSNPNMILYAYANHRPLPKIPLIWSLMLTNFNVAISVVSLFFLLAKLIANIMKLYYPVVAVVVNVALIALYSVSVYGQVGPDYADSRYPAPAAWYFRKGCGLAKPYGKYRACQIAQASLGVTLVMLVLYLINLGFALHAMWPNKVNDIVEDDEDQASATSADFKERGNWEMYGMKSPASAYASPFTPRTQAFHTLDRQLPLRQQHDVRRYA